MNGQVDNPSFEDNKVLIKEIVLFREATSKIQSLKLLGSIYMLLVDMIRTCGAIPSVSIEIVLFEARGRIKKVNPKEQLVRSFKER